MTNRDEGKPNPGRIYDYIIGGDHNFPADRAAGDHVLRAMPSMKNAMRLNRRFMYHAVRELVAGGFDCFIDLATGLPTEGYVHQLAPDALVLYNDRDADTVAYGREIVGDNPKVRYIQSDIADIDVIVAAAEEHFQGQRRVGICFVGVSFFLNDEQLRHVLRELYAWCAPGSQMAISAIQLNQEHPRIKEIQAVFQQVGPGAHSRPPEILDAFFAEAGWEVQPPGIIPAAQWVETPTWYDPADADMMELYGAIVKKRES